MSTRYDKQKSLSESDTVRNGDFWHSVWKLIEGAPGDEAPLVKKEVSLQAPRDYVQDSDKHSAN